MTYFAINLFLIVVSSAPCQFRRFIYSLCVFENAIAKIHQNNPVGYRLVPYPNQVQWGKKKRLCKLYNFLLKKAHHYHLPFNVISKLKIDNRENLLSCIHTISHDSSEGSFRHLGSIFLSTNWCQLLELFACMFSRLSNFFNLCFLTRN